MQVTDVKVFPVNEDRLKAYATITFDDCFVVRDLKVILGNAGLFVAMPSKRRKDGTFKDTAHPLNNETREMIETRVLAQFEEELKRLGVDPKSIAARRPFPIVPGTDDYDDSAPMPVAAAAGARPAPAMRAMSSAPAREPVVDDLPPGFRRKV